MGGADRVIRIALALGIIVLYFTNVLSGAVALVLLAIASIFVLTSFVSFCPIYAILKTSTCAVKKPS